MASTNSNQPNLRSTKTEHGTAKPPTLAEFNGDLNETASVLKKFLDSVKETESLFTKLSHSDKETKRSDKKREDLIRLFESKGQNHDYPRLIELLGKLQLPTDFPSTDLSSYKGELDQAIGAVTQIKRESIEIFNAKPDCIKCQFWNSKQFPEAAQIKILDGLKNEKIDLCIIVEAHIKTDATKNKIKSYFSGYGVIFVEEKRIAFAGNKINLGKKTDLIHGTAYYESTAIDNVLSYTHCVIIYRPDVNNKTENLACDGYFMEYKPPNSTDRYNDHFFSFEYRNLNFLALHRSNQSLRAHTLVLKNWLPMEKKNCVVVGDVNWDYTKQDSQGIHFHNMLKAQKFHQWVREPTRGDKIIDVVFTRKEELEVSTDVQTFYYDKNQKKPMGDHNTVNFTVFFVDHKNLRGDVRPGLSSQ